MKHMNEISLTKIIKYKIENTKTNRPNKPNQSPNRKRIQVKNTLMKSQREDKRTEKVNREFSKKKNSSKKKNQKN